MFNGQYISSRRPDERVTRNLPRSLLPSRVTTTINNDLGNRIHHHRFATRIAPAWVADGLAAPVIDLARLMKPSSPLTGVSTGRAEERSPAAALLEKSMNAKEALAKVRVLSNIYWRQSIEAENKKRALPLQTPPLDTKILSQPCSGGK